MTDRVREVETPTGPQLNVYANRKDAALWAVTLTSVVALLNFLVVPILVFSPERSIVGFLAALFLDIAISGTITYFWRWALSSKPLLIVDSRGIVDNGSIGAFGLIRWEDIQGVMLYVSTYRYFCILPRDKDQLLLQLPPMRRLWFRIFLYPRLAPGPLLIQQSLLPMPIGQLCERIANMDRATPRLNKVSAPQLKGHLTWLRNAEAASKLRNLDTRRASHIQ